MLDGTKTIGEFVFSPSSSPPSSAKLASSASADAFSITGGSEMGNSLSRSQSVGGLRSDENNLRRVWQAVLRECQRNDPERTGLVNRNTFINALEQSGDSVSSLLVFLPL
jgi:hypothetical protein